MTNDMAEFRSSTLHIREWRRGIPIIAAPRADAPILPIMQLLDELLGDAALALSREYRRHSWSKTSFRCAFEELIEQHVTFADDFGRLVRLPAVFVRHYIARVRP